MPGRGEGRLETIDDLVNRILVLVDAPYYPSIVAVSVAENILIWSSLSLTVSRLVAIY
jgi:hypothetical protein